MIPVLLVTGFLGSGKTTFLRNLAESHPDWRLVFLVNEFAETSIDGETLAATGNPTQSVVGGSLFCECKAGDFLRTMRGVVLDEHHKISLDAVVIETSGTADPDAIGALMHDHGLDRDFELRGIVTIVAPEKFLRLLGNLPVVEAQVRASDLVVINKTDTAGEVSLKSAEQAIQKLNPDARVVRAEHCRIAFTLPTRDAALPHADLFPCNANPFDTRVATFFNPTPYADLIQSVRSLPPEILRVKGTVQTERGWFRIERTVDGHHVEILSAGSKSQLVLIAHEDHEALLEHALQTLAQLPAA